MQDAIYKYVMMIYVGVAWIKTSSVLTANTDWNNG